MKATAQIFLCYARQDTAKVESLYQKLSSAGFSPWMDTRNILPGEPWKSCISKAVRRSNFFLACLSANSVDRRGLIQKEIKYALDIWQEQLDSDIYLIPVRLEDCEIPESLRDFQAVDLFKEDGWTRLVESIQVGIDRRTKQEDLERLRELDNQLQDLEPDLQLPPLEMDVLSDLQEAFSDKYRIIERLKTDRPNYIIYKALHICLDRIVIIKILAKYAVDKDAVGRFQREARILARLEHPNITKIYDSGVFKGHYYHILEFTRGDYLAAILQRLGIFPLGEAAKVILQLCGACYYAHGEGVVHGAITPGSVLLSPTGEVKLMDFAYALMEGEEKLPLGEERVTYGNPMYMAPEQIRGDAIDRRADIYALGVILCEMLTGSNPFRGPTVASILFKHLKKELGEADLNLPVSTGRVVLKAITKDPLQRYQNCDLCG